MAKETYVIGEQKVNKNQKTKAGELGKAIFSVEAIRRGFNFMSAGEGLKTDCLISNEITGQYFRIQTKYTCQEGSINIALGWKNKRKRGKDGTYYGVETYTSYKETDFDFISVIADPYYNKVPRILMISSKDIDFSKKSFYINEYEFHQPIYNNWPEYGEKPTLMVPLPKNNLDFLF